MKLLELLIKLPIKALYLWYWIIPFRFNVLAFAAYFGIMYLCYGSIHVSDIKEVVKANNLGMFWGFFVPFAVPCFISFGAMMGGDGLGSDASLSTIDRAIQFRNGQMNVASTKRASEILEKTAHLDVIKANKDNNKVFKRAEQGFNAKYGASSPSAIYKDIMEND